VQFGCLRAGCKIWCMRQRSISKLLREHCGRDNTQRAWHCMMRPKMHAVCSCEPTIKFTRSACRMRDLMHATEELNHTINSGSLAQQQAIGLASPPLTGISTRLPHSPTPPLHDHILLPLPGMHCNLNACLTSLSLAAHAATPRVAYCIQVPGYSVANWRPRLSCKA